LDTFGEGAYTAELQIIDPRTSYAVGADQASFQVTGAQLPPPVPAWVLWAILALVGVALIIAGRFYRRRKRRPVGKRNLERKRDIS